MQRDRLETNPAFSGRMLKLGIVSDESQ